MTAVVLASANPNKLREIFALFGEFGFRVLPQSDFGLETPPETGADFAANAVIKARYVCERTGFAAIADDSGLEVEVLNGEPGVRSARYAGENASDADNLDKLLDRIEPFAEDRLKACFRCAAAYATPSDGVNGRPVVVEAAWRGRLVKSPRGESGFGYDPVFFVEEYGCTAAELPFEIKNEISHRAQAFMRLRDVISGRSCD